MIFPLKCLFQPITRNSQPRLTSGLPWPVLEAKVPAARPSFPSSLRIRDHHPKWENMFEKSYTSRTYWIYLGMSINGGTPNSWMVYIRENPSINGWWLGVPPILGNLHIPKQKYVELAAPCHPPQSTCKRHLLRSSPRVILVRSTPTRRDWTCRAAVKYTSPQEICNRSVKIKT